MHPHPEAVVPTCALHAIKIPLLISSEPPGTGGNAGFLGKASWSLNPVVSLEVRGGDFPGGLQTSAVAQLCPILYNLMDCSLPGSSIHGIFQARKSTGVGCHCLFQGIFPTQGSNPGLPHYRQRLYCLSHQVIYWL